MTERVSIKDDRDLFAMIERGREMRRARGVPEPAEKFDLKEATEEWHKLRRQRTGHGFYHIIIEPTNGRYRAYPLATPEMVVEGETRLAVRQKAAEALRVYLVEVLARGESAPAEGKLVETVEISLP